MAIIDDVMTSGATITAATEAIKHAGAKQVWAMLTCLTGQPALRINCDYLSPEA